MSTNSHEWARIIQSQILFVKIRVHSWTLIFNSSVCSVTSVVNVFLQVRIAGMIDQLKRLIRDVPDFPKPGIQFRDITPLLADPGGLAMAVELMANPFRGKNINLVVGAESRGFIFGTAVAMCLSAGFGLVRKPGKLPHKRVSKTYDLEYGTDTLEMHADSIVRGQRVLIVDDVLATGGTMKACIDLVTGLGGELAGVAVLIELAGLYGRAKVGQHPVHSVLHYL